MSLRIRLMLLILIAALPVLAVQVIGSLRQRHAEEEEIAGAALRLADLEAERLAGLVELARGVTTTMAHLPAVLEHDGPACAARLRAMTGGLPEFAAAAAFTPGGKSFCRTTGDDPILIADRAYFQQVLRERTFVASGYIIGRGNHAPTMVFAAPAVDATGAMRAVVLLVFALERLPGILDAGTLADGVTVKLLDSDGAVLARLPERRVPENARPAAVPADLRFGSRGTVAAKGTDGTVRMYGFVPLPEPGRIEVVVGIPLGPTLAAIDAQMWRNLAVTGAILCLAAFIALMTGETGILRPLAAVQAAAGRFARGDLSARARIGPAAASEVGALATSLNEMADAIAARERALAASEEFGRRMLASSRDCVQVLDLDGRLLSINPYGREALEIADASAVLGRPYAELWEGESRATLGEAVALVRGGEPARFMGRLRTGSGRERWWDVSLSPIADAQGRPERLLVVSRDLTELMQADRHRELLLAELDHRVKNTLAAVQSMARRSLGAGPQADAFIGRVAAMATAHALLSGSRWEGGALTELLARTLAEHGDRIVLEGPEVHLDAQTTQSLALALHELVTNAAKYGALSAAGGGVDVRWALQQNGDRSLRLDWTEHGGPAAVRPAEMRFGLPFMQRSIEYELGGAVAVDFRPEGLQCRMTLPLGAAAAEAARPGVAETDQPLAAAPPELPASHAGRRVLVVEDTALVAMEIESVLADAGYDVAGPAASVAAARRLIEANGINAAVLDVNLQGETSFPIAEVLRGRGVPFIFLTGYSDRAIFPPELRDVPRLAKPFQRHNLLATLAAVEAPVVTAAQASS